MPHINQMMKSKFLKKEDVEGGKLYTIRAVTQENVGMDDRPEMRWVMFFTDNGAPVEQGLVLNSTNLQAAAKACNSFQSEEWVGKQVVLYNDPNVSYMGKVVGGIRLRAPRTQAPQQPTQTPVFQNPHAQQAMTPPAPPKSDYPPQGTTGADFPSADFDDDIPF